MRLWFVSHIHVDLKIDLIIMVLHSSNPLEAKYTQSVGPIGASFIKYLDGSHGLEENCRTVMTSNVVNNEINIYLISVTVTDYGVI